MSTKSNSRADHQPTPGQERNTVDLPSHPTGFAKEPNDGIYDATPILFASSIKGKLTERDRVDSYVFKTPDDVSDDFLVIFRHIDGTGIVKVEVYDPEEVKITGDIMYNASHTFKISRNKGPKYYVKVQLTDQDVTNYELEVRSKST
jgi:hypothetical protein